MDSADEEHSNITNQEHQINQPATNKHI